MDTQTVARANVLREVLMNRDSFLEFLSDPGPLQYSELDDFVKSLAS